MSMLHEVVSRALIAGGAVVEPIEPDGIEVLAPPGLAAALDLDEFARLGFGPTLPDDAIRVGLESEWIDKLAELLDARGSTLSITQNTSGRADHPPSAPDLLKKALVLENATYRRQSDQAAWTRYLLLVFRIVAISDERREDFVTLCVNESNGADADHLIEPLWAALRTGLLTTGSLPGDVELDPPWTAQQAAERTRRDLPARVRRKLQPFLSGMERRMANDLTRLFDYHTNLRREASERMHDAARKNKTDETFIRREEQRIASIEREYKAKVADLRLKYAMNVEATFLQALRLTAPVHRLRVNLLRRKGVRSYHLDWSPLSHRLDALSCESCGTPSSTHALCDDRLHILCHDCLAPCPTCGKPYCRACHGATCPRCKTKIRMAASNASR